MIFILHRGSRSTCLNNEPQEALPTPPDSVDLSHLPGELWDGDKQCQTHYGNSFRSCGQVSYV